MSSTPFSSQQQPAETESPFDWDGDEPALVRVRRLPEFQSWVKSGGLAEFAKQHGVQPDFIDRTCDVEPTVMIAYYEKLRSIPALSWEMDYERRRKPGSKLLSAAAVEAWMTLMEGWDIDEHDEDDEEQEEEKEEKKKEEAREKEEKETTAVGLVDKTPQIVRTRRTIFSPNFCVHRSPCSPAKKRHFPECSPEKRKSFPATGRPEKRQRQAS